jgi:ribonuclease HIII
MSHFEVLDAAKVIKENAEVHCKFMNVSSFNKNYKKIKNMKALNAIAQNGVHNDFKQYGDHVTDQFVNSNKYFSYLEEFKQEPYKDVFFTTKAEDKYMEVAAGAIVAKAMYNL